MKITLLGLDGSGKSTVSKMLKDYFENEGKSVKIIPFHKWVFADFFRDSLKFGKLIDGKRTQGRTSYHTPRKKSLSAYIKPPIALIDNILFYLLNRPKRGNEVYIYDRFISATQIKMAALGYHTSYLNIIWQNITTEFTFYIDVHPQVSVLRQKQRNDPYTYPADILEIERKYYLNLAKKKNIHLIENNSNVDDVVQKIINIINSEKIT